MKKGDARDYVAKTVLPAFLAERARLDRVDRWYRWDHDQAHKPRHSNSEYKGLQSVAQVPWLTLIVTTVAQGMFVDGYRQARAPDDAAPWGYWQANKMDARQIAINRAALAYGQSYVTVLPGKTMFGDAMPTMRGVSPRRMVTLWADQAADDWPLYALQADPAKVNGDWGWALRLYDDQDVHYLNADSGGTRIDWIESRTHGVGVCPVVRFCNSLDLEGRADGEVEPFIPLAGCLDQTKFDRLVVQRFAAWVVRTISGMTLPEAVEGVDAEKLRLAAESILIAEDKDTKFGSLPASPLDGLIAAYEADVRTLAAVSQTPAHEMLGQMANLSAEALAAAEASLTRKKAERKTMFGESYEQALRLGAHIMGDEAGARDDSAQVRWREDETRSLAQAADALGKMAQMLGVPVEMLWEKIPGWTDQDVERAKSIAAQGGGMVDLLRQMSEGLTPPEPSPVGG